MTLGILSSDFGRSSSKRLPTKLLFPVTSPIQTVIAKLKSAWPSRRRAARKWKKSAANVLNIIFLVVFSALSLLSWNSYHSIVTLLNTIYASISPRSPMTSQPFLISRVLPGFYPYTYSTSNVVCLFVSRNSSWTCLRRPTPRSTGSSESTRWRTSTTGAREVVSMWSSRTRPARDHNFVAESK